jgi:quinol-cytochrome oxidoreductase complex cytochrome b subunit
MDDRTTTRASASAPDPGETPMGFASDAANISTTAAGEAPCFDPLDKSAEHHKEWGDQPTIKFFPFHVTAEVTNVFLLMCVYLLLAALRPAGLETRANALITPVGIKPEWYFLFLYAYMHYVPPVVGTLTPLVLLGVLGAWPWIDRNPERKPSRRKIAIAGSVLVILVIVALSIIGIME